MCHLCAIELSPARHLPDTDFGKHRCENKFKHICNCRDSVIEVQGAPPASFNLANRGKNSVGDYHLFICFSCSYGPSKASTSGYCWRWKTELKGPILAINMLHCLVTKCKPAGVPASLPELRFMQSDRFPISSCL